MIGDLNYQLQFITTTISDTFRCLKKGKRTCSTVRTMVSVRKMISSVRLEKIRDYPIRLTSGRIGERVEVVTEEQIERDSVC